MNQTGHTYLTGWFLGALSGALVMQSFDLWGALPAIAIFALLIAGAVRGAYRWSKKRQ